MKQSSFRAVCLMLLMVCVAVASAFGDDNTVNLESRLLDPLNGTGYEWQVRASKFASPADDEGETFPRLAMVSAWPSAVERVLTAEERDNLKSIGIWGRFDRRGYNWIDVYPVQAGENGETGSAEIPIPGRVRQLDVWVWGSNLHYRLEAYVRDYQGVVHVLDFGSIYHTGWKNIRVNVPASIPQSKRVLPRIASLTFVKFRIWTPPTEPVNNFYVYLNRLKIYTDTFETYYDGEELGDPGHVQELWSGGSAN
jgi:hypothetical protein